MVSVSLNGPTRTRYSVPVSVRRSETAAATPNNARRPLAASASAISLNAPACKK